MTLAKGQYIKEEGLLELQQQVVQELKANQQHLKSLILSEIAKLGYCYEVVNDRNIVAWRDVERTECGVAVRALLPNDNDHNSDSEEFAQVLILLSVMNSMSMMQEGIEGAVYFCFECYDDECKQENVGAILNFLNKKQINTVLGVGLSSEIKVGKVSIEGGPISAGVCEVTANIISEVNHSSCLKQGCNPIAVASHLLVNLSSVLFNKCAAKETVRFDWKTLHCDQKISVAENSASIKGHIYFFDERDQRKVIDIFRNVTEHTVEMYDCFVEFGKEFDYFVPVMNTDIKYSNFAKKVALQFLSAKSFVSSDKVWKPNVFSHYTKQYPCVYAIVGFDKTENSTLLETTLLGTQLTLSYIISFLRCQGEV